MFEAENKRSKFSLLQLLAEVMIHTAAIAGLKIKEAPIPEHTDWLSTN